MTRFCSDGSVSTEIVTGFLNEGIYEIEGGDTGLYGLSDTGVYNFNGHILIPGRFEDISVGRTFNVGISSTQGSADENCLYSWGAGEFGELGLGPMMTHVEKASKINYKAKFVQVDSGVNHSLAVDKSGNVFAWGQNFERQLGLYSKNSDSLRKVNPLCETEDVLFTPRFIPLSLSNPILKVACGHSFSAVVTKNGEIWTW